MAKIIDDEILDSNGLDKDFSAPADEYRYSDLAKYLIKTGKKCTELSKEELDQFKY